MASHPDSGKNTLLRVKQPEELLAQPTVKVKITTAAEKVKPKKSNPAATTALAVHVAEVDTPVLSATPRMTSSLLASNSGCVMWIHLQASICTEWEHTSMVLSQNKIPGTVSIASLLQVGTLHYLIAVPYGNTIPPRPFQKF